MSPTHSARRVAAALAIPALLFAGRAHAELLGGRPDDASLDGHLGDWLFDVTTVMISILFLIMCGVIAIAAIGHKDRPGRKAWYTHGSDRKSLLFTAAVCCGIFFIVDGTLLINSFIDLHEHFWKWPDSPNTLKVEIVAQQWGWNVRYAGPDGKFNTADDVLKWNEMAVPIDTPVYLKMRSKDVIHSFYLPNFRVKQDVVPEVLTQLWFQAVKPGRFEIGCAQHCGVNHYKMRGWLSVLPGADFAAWMREQSADSQRRYDPTDAQAHWGWDWEG